MMKHEVRKGRQGHTGSATFGPRAAGQGVTGKAGRYGGTMGAIVGTLLLFAGLSPPLLSADASGSRSAFFDIGGIPVGENPQFVEWLVPLETARPVCASEAHYHARDAVEHSALAGVRIAEPGLVYKFHNDRLYAIEALLPSEPHAFEAVLDALTRRYGLPDVTENWAGSPPDSFTYRQRLRMAGWFQSDARQNVWLTGYRDGGSIVVTRNAASAKTRWDHAAGCDGPA